MCLQTHGGFGFAEEYDVERSSARRALYQIAPISTNLVLCYLAEHVLHCRAPTKAPSRVSIWRNRPPAAWTLPRFC